MEMDIDVKILGPGCKKCEEVANTVRKVAEEHGIAVQVEKITGMEAIAEYGVLSTPALVVDGDVKCAGRVPDPAEILGWLRKHTANS
jgi:small redox-active disulfide protein 2